MWDCLCCVVLYFFPQTKGDIKVPIKKQLTELIDWIIAASAATPAALGWCWHSRWPSAPCLPPPLPMDRRSSSMNESLDVRCWCFWIEMLLSGNTVSQSILPLHKRRRHSWGCAYKTCLFSPSFRASLLLISPSKIMKKNQHNVG